VKSMRWSRVLAGLICLFVGLASTSLFSAPAPFCVHKKRDLMGTVFDIVAYDESLPRVSDAVDKAFEEMARLDDVMSDYKADSALSKLNRSAHFQAQTVPPDLYRVIEESLQYSRLSDGKFDITVAPLANLWKAAVRGQPVPSAADLEKLRGCVGYQNVKLLPPDKIEFHSPCLQIDLGAIGKGYALDRGVEVLRMYGISNALLDAGGSSIYAMGKPPGQSAWTLNLSDPSRKLGPHVMLSDSSVSTSEQTPRSALMKNSPGHIVDPGKGVPLQTAFDVSVVAKTATASDALSTTLLLMGPEPGEQLLKQLPGTAAVWVSSDGRSKSVSSGPQILFANRVESLTETRAQP
jgi:thiamine biosynthesis lipoprotein